MSKTLVEQKPKSREKQNANLIPYTKGNDTGGNRIGSRSGAVVLRELLTLDASKCAPKVLLESAKDFGAKINTVYDAIIWRLVLIALGKDVRHALTAISTILDRTDGKASQNLMISGPDEKAIQIETQQTYGALSKLSKDKLIEIQTILKAVEGEE